MLLPYSRPHYDTFCPTSDWIARHLTSHTRTGVGTYLRGTARAVPLLNVGRLEYAWAVPLLATNHIFLRGNALIVNQRRVQNVSQRVRKLFQTVSTRDNFNFHCSCTFMTTCVSETSCRGKLLSRPNNYKKITLSLRWPRDAPNIWVPWKFSRVLTSKRLLFPKFVTGFCSDWY